MAFSSCKETTELSDYQNELIGAYRYTGNHNGMIIISKEYFLMVPNMETESAMVDSLNTGENVSKQIYFGAGTWSVQDSIVTCTFQNHSNPASIGSTIRFTRTINGNNVDHYVLGKNDEVIGRGSSIKLD